MLDGDDWFEVMEEVIVIPECTPEAAPDTAPEAVPDTAPDTYLEVNEVIVVSDSDDDDKDDDEWLVTRGPLKPLVMDISKDPFWYTPATPPTPSPPSMRKTQRLSNVSALVSRSTNQRPFSGPPNGPFQGHQIIQKERSYSNNSSILTMKCN
ncbi:hypothetical protein SNE40_014186 [Patella caerulea]